MDVRGVEEIKTLVGGSEGKKVLGKEDFLKLLIEQLKHQDPLNPMDSLNFTAQLAQFTSLEQLFNISDGIEKLVNSVVLRDNSYLISLIGKEIDATIGKVTLVGGKGVISFKADGDITRAMVRIKDENGRVLREIEVSPVEEGINTVDWDGADKWGSKLPDGTYNIEVYGYKLDGTEVPLSGVATGVVKSVSLDTGKVYLEDGREIDASSIVKVRDVQDKLVEESGESEEYSGDSEATTSEEKEQSGSFQTLKNIFTGLIKMAPIFLK